MRIEKIINTNPRALPSHADLGFGKYFSDHWFIARFSSDKGWYEARVEPYGPMLIDPAASVLHYGQALFEGMKAFAQQDGSVSLFRPEFNYDRICEGAARLCLEAPPKEIFFSGLKTLLETDLRWIPREDQCSLYIRPTLVGTEPFLGVRPSREVLFYIILSPVGAYYSSGSQPVKIWMEDKALRAAPGGLGATKAGANYAASLHAALEAKKKGYAQVLWLDVNHSAIEEVGTMNVFFVFNDQIVTPALNGSILAGGVRDSVLHLLRSEGTPVEERRITIEEVFSRYQRGELLEAFGTGTAAVISPIGELCHQNQAIAICNNTWGPVSHRLYETLTGIQRGRIPDRFGWMKKVSQLG